MAKSNYSDKKVPDDYFNPAIYHDRRSSPRAYTPSDGDSESGTRSSLFTDSLSGDWSWKPQRDRTATIFGTFRTFHGVPPGGAELSHVPVSADGTNVCGTAHYQRRAA